MIEKVKNEIKILSIENTDEHRRYVLKKSWQKGKGRLAVIMHNPNIANEIKGDKSTNICTNKAIDLGCNKIFITNLYSKRGRKSKTLPTEFKIFEDENLKYIKKMLKKADFLLLAWGDKPGDMVQHEDFKNALLKFNKRKPNATFVFEINKSGEPIHASMKGESTPLINFDLNKYYN